MDEVIDLRFPLRGRSVPEDHGYALYAALSREMPRLHGAEWLAVHPIRGSRRADGRISLERGSALKLRIPAAQIPGVLPLAGRELRIEDAPIWLDSPTVHALEPCRSLDAKLVAIRFTRKPLASSGSLDKTALEQLFRAELGRQLVKLAPAASFALCGKRDIRVGGKRIVGFSVRLTELDESTSVTLQREGLGGKRRMGCGVFSKTIGPRGA